MRRLSILLVLLLIGATTPTVQQVDDTAIAKLPQRADTVVINFWATWCVPCVEEIPIFVKLHQQQKNIQIIGISMDNLDQNKRVAEFAAKHHVNYDIAIRNGKKFEDMVNSLDPDWGGGIPATFVFRDGKRVFSKVGQITEKELKAALE